MALMDGTDILTGQITAGNAVAVGLALSLLYLILEFSTSSKSSLPFINGRKFFEFGNACARQRCKANAKELLKLGLKTVRGYSSISKQPHSMKTDRGQSKAFYLHTDHGPRLVLGNEYAREIHNNPHLSHPKAIGAEMHCDIPGMEGYRYDYFPPHLRLASANLNIKRALTFFHKLDISSLLDEYWTENPVWHRFALNPVILEMVSQVTAEIRSGKELSQNPNWRRLCVDYTVHSFIAANDLSQWPRFLRPIVHWFLPSFKQLRADIKEARIIYAPVAEARLAKKHEAIANGESPGQYDDMVHWIDEHAKGAPFDGVMHQMLTAQMIIHGTADMITQAIFDICERPQLLEDLRAEIISVIGQEELTQVSLSNLHLMDSVVKESQRIKPLFLVTMKRYAEQSIVLSDETVIPKGSLVVVSMQNMWNESKYPSPHEFQSDRFLKRRQTPGQENAAELTSATVDHMGFGFGRHACPGRFYAAALIKLTLCHILIKYDMRLVGGRPAVETYGMNMTANHAAKIEVRRRQQEITLKAPEGLEYGLERAGKRTKV